MSVYAAKETKNTPSTITVTIKRLGPSGSLKKKNNSLVQMMAVTANMINDSLFDLKCKFVVLLPVSICGVYTQI